ncbi:FxsA family protein [Methylophaga sp. OBS4]|uniref:FxsA family protein n=1 Tax=Methylophaga sp. OBS4 TaxID=2991935 RepID=UPI002253820B|nr:FxsA family protein [Methylophaga sp. OBS4]MCX4186356.1 FxsA family protein [Methylophaga sp. OBS4]
MFRFLFLLFLIIPLVEIYFLIQVGKVIGAGWTVFLVVGTAVIGAFLLRLQGFSTLQRAQTVMARGELPAVEMLEGLTLLISGALLLTPGFVTDALGFLLLIPPVRQSMIRQILKNSQIILRQHSSAHFHQHRSPPSSHDESSIIEGEVVDDDDPHQLR